jgi:GntP family gluconate:H+ symporter
MSFTFIISAIVLSIVLIVILTSVLKLNAFLSMLLVSLLLALATIPVKDIVEVLNTGFGDTLKSIGLIIILGATIGIVLDKTGATLSMANFILSKIGNKKSDIAIGITGFITGLPIFCNSGFIVLSGLNRSLAIRTGKPLLMMTTILAISLYSVHCLIPPHPGPTAAAGRLSVNFGYLILLGLAVCIPALIVTYFWIRARSKKINNSLISENKEKQVSVQDLPSAFMSFLPVVVPLLLIVVKSIMTLIFKSEVNYICKGFVSFVGEPVIALLIGVILSLFLIKKFNKIIFNGFLEEAIEKAGPILIITAAGGAFGAVIRATGFGEHTGTLFQTTGLGIFLPFLIAAMLKTAQGSSTVALITTANIIAPMLTSLGLDSESGRLLATLSMGAGSIVVSHANDSYFWVVAKFSELDVSDMLKCYTSSTLVLGATCMFSIYVLSLFMI